MKKTTKHPFIGRLAFLMIILIMTYGKLSAQTINGIIMDSKTSQPLAYVHIGIAGKGIGTISDERGHFNFQINPDHKYDTLTFSMIGYYDSQIAIANLFNGKTAIKMNPSITRLKEVVIQDIKIREQFKFGRTKPTKITSGASGIDNYGIGQEIGTTIKNDGGIYIIDAISFHLRMNTVDSILYRINIYSLKDELPSNSILKNELYITAYKRDKWVTKQIEDVIIFDQDLFISIEPVRRWNNKGDNLLFYSHGEGSMECKSYIRSTSQDQWTTNFAIPLTLYMTVEKVK